MSLSLHLGTSNYGKCHRFDPRNPENAIDIFFTPLEQKPNKNTEQHQKLTLLLQRKRES